MAELEKAITTQEELDAIIKDRVARAKETAAKSFEGWISPEEMEKSRKEAEKQLAELQKALAESEKKSAEKDASIEEMARYKTDLEKTRIAIAAGLDVKFAGRLQGENAEAWKKDAAELAKDFAAAKKTAPIGSSETPPGKTTSNKQFETWFNENFH